jgi:hypothetical protein
MLAYFFILFAVAIRFMPHPFSFTPVTAALLFFGARAPRRRMWIPLILFAATDVILTTVVYHYSVNWEYLVTWAWYAAMLWFGTSLKEADVKQTTGWLRILGSALAGSVSFFLLSNFTVWVGGSMYPHTFAGLMTCYDAGLPFFRRGVESDLIFTAAMFSTPVPLHALASRMQKSGDHTAAA